MAQSGVRFARVHGHIVPMKAKSGGGGGKAPAKSAPKKAPAKKPAKGPSKGVRFAVGMVGGAMIGMGAYMAMPFLKGAHMAAAGALANRGLKKAGLAAVKAGKGKEALGFVRSMQQNKFISQSGKRWMQSPHNALGVVVGGVYAGLGGLLMKTAIKPTKPKKQNGPRSSV